MIPEQDRVRPRLRLRDLVTAPLFEALRRSLDDEQFAIIREDDEVRAGTDERGVLRGAAVGRPLRQAVPGVEAEELTFPAARESVDEPAVGIGPLMYIGSSGLCQSCVAAQPPALFSRDDTQTCLTACGTPRARRPRPPV